MIAVSELLVEVVALVYYWDVFYSYGLYPFATLGTPALVALLCGLVVLGWDTAVLVSRFCKCFACKAAIAVFCVGLLFAFANPPLETPDEVSHYFRTYAVSNSILTLDYDRSYSQDVIALCAAYVGWWTIFPLFSPLNFLTTVHSLSLHW